MRTIRQVSNNIKNQLKDICENGLNPVYNSLEDYMWDMYPDFSWNNRSIKEARYLLQDNEFSQYAEIIRLKYNFDLVQNLTESIIEWTKEMEE